MIKIKDEHIAKLLEQIERDRDILKELKIEVELNILHESVTLTKTKSVFHDSINTKYVFSGGKLTKIVFFNNVHFESKKLGIYDHLFNAANIMHCDAGFFTDEKDDIISLYNKVITANKALKEMNGFE